MWQRLNQEKEIALTAAKLSPCVRRKYGAVLFSILDPEYRYVNYNGRVSNCCDEFCIRDRLQIGHAQNTDMGGEIHAEQALITRAKEIKGTLLIVGYHRNGTLLYDKECWPCYSCARIIKYAGVRSVWVPLDDTSFSVYQIDEILSEYEDGFESVISNT